MGRRAKRVGLLVTAVAAFLGPRALAAPATAKVFEVQTRESPDEGAKASPAPVQPIAAAAPPARGPIVYVKDLDHLTEVVSEDDVIHRKAKALVTGRTTGYLTLFAGVGLGSLLTIGGVTFLAGEDCNTGTGGCTREINGKAAGYGIGIMLLASLIALAVMPSHGDVRDVVNAWNARHTDRQLTLDRQPAINN